MEITDFEKENSTCEELLRVHFSKRLTFDYQMLQLCKIIIIIIIIIVITKKKCTNCMSQSYIHLSKRKFFMNAFFELQFKYCSLIQTCHSCGNNRKIDRLRGRCLRIIYNDKQSSFKESLEKDSSVSFPGRYFKISATKLYKVCNNF